METIDLRKQLKHLYFPSAKKVEVVDMPEFQFLVIDGALKPGEMPGTSPEFEGAIGALYSTAYTLKFACKKRKEDPIDYPVMALEGLWNAVSGEFDAGHPEDWKWTLMILQPDAISAEMFHAAVAQAEKKRPNPAMARVRLERFREGLCLQIMHVGPYADEPTTIERMRAFARDNGYAYAGRHHEIYLGDPRRSAPEKLKTVLRQAVRREG